MQKTDTFIINGMAMVQSTEIRDTRAYNLLLKCLRGKSQVSLSAHGTYSRTPAGATDCIYSIYIFYYIYIYIYCDGVEVSHDKESSNKYPGGWIYSQIKWVK